MCDDEWQKRNRLPELLHNITTRFLNTHNKWTVSQNRVMVQMYWTTLS